MQRPTSTVGAELKVSHNGDFAKWQSKKVAATRCILGVLQMTLTAEYQDMHTWRASDKVQKSQKQTRNTGNEVRGQRWIHCGH